MLEWIANIIFGGIIGEIFAAVVAAGVTILVGIVNTVIGVFAWFIFQIATWFIDVAIQMNTQVAVSKVIENGFEKVLMFANLGIIVALVVIAFMVMLRKGDAGKLLARFVIMALLINFGFYITTKLFVEPVDEITRQIDIATNFGPITFATAFIPPLQIKTIAEPPGGPNPLRINEESILPGLTFDVLISLMSVLFSVAFLVVGTITLFGFAGILFVRYIYLGILIILLPIAWLSYVFPNIKIAGGHPFTQWWGQFVRWLLFAPISMFFFFLAVQSVDIDALDPTRIDETRHYFNEALIGGLASIADMVIIIGLMVGGMIVANKMSITGASMVLNTTKKVGKQARTYARDKGIQAATTPLRTETGKRATEALQRTGQDSGRVLRTLSGPIRQLGQAASAGRRRGETLYDEHKKRLDKKSLNEQARSISRESAPARLGIMTNLGIESRGAYTELDNARQRQVNVQSNPVSTPEQIAQAAATITRAQDRVNNIQDLIINLPARINAQFNRLERLYGQHETRGRAGATPPVPPPVSPAPPPAPSDERLKTNIQPVSWDWTPEALASGLDLSTGPSGFVAQDVQKIWPECVEEVDGFLHLDYQKIAMRLASMLKEIEKNG